MTCTTCITAPALANSDTCRACWQRWAVSLSLTPEQRETIARIKANEAAVIAKGHPTGPRDTLAMRAARYAAEKNCTLYKAATVFGLELLAVETAYARLYPNNPRRST